MGDEHLEADGSFPHDVEGVGREGKQKSQKGGHAINQAFEKLRLRDFDEVQSYG